jgi:hypothetical protein
MAIAILRVEGGQYTSDALDDDLNAYLNDVNAKDLSAMSRESFFIPS